MTRIVQHPTHPDHSDDLAKLRSENARLIALLDQHGIVWRAPDRVEAAPPRAMEPSRLSTDEKVTLFRRLFRGRADVYSLRWEGKSGKTGYAPACANEWKAGIAQSLADMLERDAGLIEHAGQQAFESALGVAPPTPLPDRPVFVARFKEVERWSHEGILHAFVQPAVQPKQLWPQVRLGDVIADLENGWSPQCLGHPARDGKWGVLKMGAVSFGTFDETQNKELPDRLNPRPAHEVQRGDVLISRANVVRYVGACAYVGRTRQRLLLCDKIFRVRFYQDRRLLPAFLAESMRLPSVRKQIEARLTGTSPTMKNISKPALLDLCFPLPPADNQKHLVAALQYARRSAGAKRTEADTLRTSAWSAFESALFTPGDQVK